MDLNAQDRRLDAECDVAAVVYSPLDDPDDLLTRFAEDRLREGVRVAGLIQHGHCHANAGLLVTSYPSGEVVRLSQPLGSGSTSCSLDAGRLVEASRPLREGLANSQVDLVILNRFGKLEQDGRGLRQEIIEAVAAEVPLLIAVPNAAFDAWLDFSGGMSVKLPCRRDALERWWRSVDAHSRRPTAAAPPTFCSECK